MNEELQRKYKNLRGLILSYGSVAVAFSGGADSTLLVKVAHDVVGERLVAITLAGNATPTSVVREARAWAAGEGIDHEVVTFDELTVPEFAANVPQRCYFCKKAIFSEIGRVAERKGCAVVADGSNVDDQGDYRPGLRALAELGVASPLRDAGFTKADVRALSRELGLPTWDMPSAACLASRFAYGDSITREKLRRVEEAEEFLRGLGLVQLRVRVHGDAGELARIEVEQEQIARLAKEEVRVQVVERLRELGFSYVSLDLTGFRSGAMNEVL